MKIIISTRQTLEEYFNKPSVPPVHSEHDSDRPAAAHHPLQADDRLWEAPRRPQR